MGIFSKRKPEYIRKKGRIIYPYTLFEAILDDDDKSLKEKLSEITREFFHLKESVKNGALQGPQGAPGPEGKSIEVRVSENNILQWRVQDTTIWNDLLDIKEITPDGKIKDENGNIVEINDLIQSQIDSRICNDLEEEDLEGKLLSAEQGKFISDYMVKILDFLETLPDIEGPIKGEDGKDGKDGKTPMFRVRRGVLQWKYTDWYEDWEDLYDLKSEGLFEIKDTLDSDSTTSALSANQGKILSGQIKTLTDLINNIDFSGTDYNDDIYEQIPVPAPVDIKVDMRLKDDKIQWKLNDGLWTDLADLKEYFQTIDVNTVIADDLVTNDSNKALSASQGVAIKRYLDTIMGLIATDETTVEDVTAMIDMRVEGTTIQWREGKKEWQDLINLEGLCTGGASETIRISDSLEDESIDAALSAKQGSVLNGKILQLMQFLSSYDPEVDNGYITEDDIAEIIERIKDETRIQIRYKNGYLQYKTTDADTWGLLIDTRELFDLSVSDSLDDTRTDVALSANQGNVLLEKINNIIRVLSMMQDTEIEFPIEDSLECEDPDRILSARQGKILSEQMDNVLERMNKYIAITERNATTLYRPGYIDDSDNIFIAPNEWTATYYEYVEPNTTYTFVANSECPILRYTFYTITPDGQLLLQSNNMELGVTKAEIYVPRDVYYVKLGFNTKQPSRLFLNYTFNKK